MSGTYIKAETEPARQWMRDTKVLTGRAVKKSMVDTARDAALLARTRAPHNMKKTLIKWAWTPLGAAVIADGAPAAYDGGEIHSKFKHPVFASPNIPREKWNWASQNTDPFIEKTVHEVADDEDERLEEALQPIFDRE